jgi:regulator of sigma E protease
VFHISEGFALGLWIIPILAFLILIHEAGHFFAARSVGVKVEEFGIGIPPRIKGWMHNGVLWSINWIPFGGFVRVLGEDGANMEPGSMNTKGPYQRAFFLVAGSGMNFIAAIVLSIVLVGIQGVPPATDSVYINRVEPSSPAEAAGWHAGDRIVSIDGHTVTSSTGLGGYISDFAGHSVPVTIERDGKEVTTHVTPRQNPPKDQGATGIIITEGRASTVRITNVRPGSIAAQAGWQGGDTIVAVNGVTVHSGVQVQAALDDAQQPVTVTLKRGDKTIDTQVSVPVRGIKITGVAKGSPAADASLYPTDEITRIGDTPVTNDLTLYQALDTTKGKTVEVTYLRNDTSYTTKLEVPDYQETTDALNAIGINAALISPYTAMGADGKLVPTYTKVSALEIVPQGVAQFWDITGATFAGIKQIITGGVSPSQIAGPVGMGQMTSELLQEAGVPQWVVLFQITVIISLNLGILNLLPLPALDGGRLLFVLIEILRGGKRIAPEKEGLVHLTGLVLLLGLMFLVMFGDVSRLLNGQSFIP